jgi:predicted transcriptional regulator
MGNRRSIDIASDVLEAANWGASKTQIMYIALLCHKQIREYGSFLTERAIIK